MSKAWSAEVANSTLQHVWDVINDAASYETWNPMFWFKGGPFSEGKRLKLVLRRGGIQIPVKVTVFEDKKELRWDASFLGLGGSHYFRLIELAEDEIQIVHGEDFTGIGLIWPYVRKQVHEEYQAVVNALCAHIEATA